MRNFICAAIFAAVSTIFFGIDSATADNRCPSASRDACIAFLQAEIETLKGRQAPRVVERRQQTKQTTYRKQTTQKVVRSGGEVCLYARVRSQSSTSAIVLYEGPYRGDGKATNVLKTWTGDGWQKGAGGYYKQICLDGSLIAGKRSVTICNIDGHNTWSSSDIAYLLRVKRIGKGDAANLYGGGGF